MCMLSFYGDYYNRNSRRSIVDGDKETVTTMETAWFQ